MILPSLWQTIAGNLTVVTLLARFAMALAAGIALVWAVTGVVLHYARVQARNAARPDRRDFGG